ncbi:MAG: hypothetical protein IK141_06365, partial [Clostridia bacterium]|nr:hypothetical protein [Clostridia bacterium]
MPKDIDELLRDVFGSGKTASYSITPKTAEAYKETGKRIGAGIEALEKQQSSINKKLQEQLDELKKMSGDLDMEKIQKQVDKDFGLQSSGKPQTAAATAVQDPRPEAQRFGDLLPVLTEQLIGQDRFLKKLVIAFKRPFVTGWNSPDGVRNAMLVYGRSNSGRHTAVRLIAEKMAQLGLLPMGDVQVLDLALYPGQSEERLFLQDLYQALLPGGVVLLDHYESCHPAFLQQLGELICTGKLHLASRYVMQKGHLVDAGTALATQAIGAIHANGRYLVIGSEKGREGLAGAFGAKVVDALG